MRIAERFDRWVETGPFTSADLGIYRIVYALCALFTAPDITWLGRQPDFLFHAPPGPLRLLSGFPSPTALLALEVLRSAALILLGLGLWTKFASIFTWLMLSITYGLTYCMGNIDHNILVVIAPLVLVFAHWGDRFSLDALRCRREPLPQRQWPLRLLAILVGWAWFAAAATKLLTGWLSLSSEAARGYFVIKYLTVGRQVGLSDWVAVHDSRVAWELLDWVTVIFEFSILLAVPWWRAFRITLAIATIFHLSVLLIMNIDFNAAVVAYGAFVSWTAVARRTGATRLFASAWARELGRVLGSGRRAYPVLALAGVTVGAVAWFLMVDPVGSISTGLIGGTVVIVLGAVIGASYLAIEVKSMLGIGARELTSAH
ncbi:hypothetical protein QN239_18675 [Mycolicibacterium sp. Y3]